MIVESDNTRVLYRCQYNTYCGSTRVGSLECEKCYDGISLFNDKRKAVEQACAYDMYNETDLVDDECEYSDEFSPDGECVLDKRHMYIYEDRDTSYFYNVCALLEVECLCETSFVMHMLDKLQSGCSKQFNNVTDWSHDQSRVFDGILAQNNDWKDLTIKSIDKVTDTAILIVVEHKNVQHKHFTCDKYANMSEDMKACKYTSLLSDRVSSILHNMFGDLIVINQQPAIAARYNIGWLQCFHNRTYNCEQACAVQILVTYNTFTSSFTWHLQVFSNHKLSTDSLSFTVEGDKYTCVKSNNVLACTFLHTPHSLTNKACDIKEPYMRQDLLNVISQLVITLFQQIEDTCKSLQ